jgi:hypothetical protein
VQVKSCRDDDAAGIGALDSVSNEQHRTLRAKAQHNIISVMEAVPGHDRIAPHLQEIIAALWLRSIAVGNLAGAEPATLQVDITCDKAIDDNALQVELATIVDSSFNIHSEGTRLVFLGIENPQAKLMAYARNDKLFSDGADMAQLAKEIRCVIGGTEEVARTFRVIALPKSWMSDPWSTLDEAERPENWDGRLPIVVLPEEPDDLGRRLGHWLKENLQKYRNSAAIGVPAGTSVYASSAALLGIRSRCQSGHDRPP